MWILLHSWAWPSSLASVWRRTTTLVHLILGLVQQGLDLPKIRWIEA